MKFFLSWRPLRPGVIGRPQIYRIIAEHSAQVKEYRPHAKSQRLKRKTGEGLLVPEALQACYFHINHKTFAGRVRYRLNGRVINTIRAVLIIVKERPRESVMRP